MGASTFDQEQLDSMGAISLDGFASCLAISLISTREARARTQAPLAKELIEMMGAAPALCEARRRAAVLHGARVPRSWHFA